MNRSFFLTLYRFILHFPNFEKLVYCKMTDVSAWFGCSPINYENSKLHFRKLGPRYLCKYLLLAQ